MAPGTKPSRGGADFDRFVHKSVGAGRNGSFNGFQYCPPLTRGWFRPFEINPVMGIKGCRSRLAARRAQRKTHRTRSCLSAQGQLLRVWLDRDRRYIAGFQTRTEQIKFSVCFLTKYSRSTIQPRQNIAPSYNGQYAGLSLR